jgi:phosphonate transport system substrate-binding protein
VALMKGYGALVAVGVLIATLTTSAAAQTKIRFAVGPFQPTAGDTRRAYEPFFKYLAQKLSCEYEMFVTTDWAGIAIALANNQADVAWMGKWATCWSTQRPMHRPSRQ